MKKTIALVIIALVAGYYFAGTRAIDTGPIGSVQVSSEYRATSTRDFVGTALPNYSILKPTAGTLGSVVITGAAAGDMIFYDATSSAPNATFGSTTLVVIPASTAAGTYTFDLIFRRGLLYELTGTTPTSTITWR